MGVLLSTKNDWPCEINAKIAKVERASFALYKFLKSKALSKKIKVRVYTTISHMNMKYRQRQL